ncbi:hypothetical protein MTP02_04160 [Streptomyces albus]|nr:hypothetical protein MTP02_04160 [Streptomyces albus]
MTSPSHVAIGSKKPPTDSSIVRVMESSDIRLLWERVGARLARGAFAKGNGQHRPAMTAAVRLARRDGSPRG